MSENNYFDAKDECTKLKVQSFIDKININFPDGETEESSGPIVKMTGYLTVQEVRTLMETMLQFLKDRTTDSDKFSFEITGNGVTHELLIEHKEVV